MCGFSLPGFWPHKGEPTLAQGTGELVAPPDLPHVALLARLYHGVEATSCRGAQLFFVVCFDWHLASKYEGPFKLGHMMFRESNQECPPEVQTYNAVIVAQ